MYTISPAADVFRPAQTIFLLRGLCGLYYLCNMLQNILVGLVFIAAAAYVARLVYRNFQSRSACESGCGKCGAVDFAKIEKQLKEKGI
jgi:hypothetical protein